MIDETQWGTIRALKQQGHSKKGIARELYAAVVLDRALRMPVLMASQEGGVEIPWKRSAASEGIGGVPRAACSADLP